MRRPASVEYDVFAQIESEWKDARKEFVEIAGKVRISRGFPQVFNGSDSEKRRRVAYTGIDRPARNRGGPIEKYPAWGRSARMQAAAPAHVGDTA
ncbi:hypothetical protein [Burkholderia pseudomultivorans]|uniref:hypothetical protein n=1 Tax=Burkholderia pseudomultivorans TaxID=1207504 RepID=UPI000A8A7399|nr:hypothetical protein [Burkholderia pseudomultivorans]